MGLPVSRPGKALVVSELAFKNRRGAPLPGPRLPAELELRVSDVRTVDTKTAQRPVISMEYMVTGDIEKQGKGLLLSDFNAFPVAPGDVRPLDETRRFQPGSQNTLAVMRALVERIRAAFPHAESLIIEGDRTTDGFKGETERRLVIPLVER